LALVARLYPIPLISKVRATIAGSRVVWVVGLSNFPCRPAVTTRFENGIESSRSEKRFYFNKRILE
jgi:hypothetical protein